MREREIVNNDGENKAIGYLLIAAFLATPLLFSRATTEIYGLVKVGAIELFAIAVFVIMTWEALKKNLISIRLPLEAVFALGFFAVALLSLAWSVNFHAGLTAIALFAANLVFFFAMMSVAAGERRIIKAVVASIITSAVLASVWCVIQNNGLSMKAPRLVYTSTFGNPIFFSQFLTVAFLLSAAMAAGSARQWQKALYIVGALFILAMLIFIRSIGAYIGVLIGAIYAGYSIYKNHIIRLRKVILIIAAITLAASLTSAVFLGHAIRSSVNMRQIQNLMRVYVWSGSVNMIKARPLTGFGAGNFEYSYPLYRTPKEKEITPRGVKYTKAHNEFLQVWVEMGIFGLLAFMGLLWAIFRRRPKPVAQDIDKSVNDSFVKILEASLLALLVQSMFNPMLEVPTSALLFWSLAGLLVGLRSGQGAGAGVMEFRFKIGAGQKKAALGGLCLFLAWLTPTHVIRPLAGDYFFEKAQVAESKGDLHGTISVANNSLKFYPHRWEVLFLLAKTQQGMGAYREAIDNYKKAARYHPNSVIIWNNIGTAYMKDGQVDKTIEAFKKVIDIDNANVGAHYNLAIVYRSNNQTALADSEFARVSEISPAFFGNMYLESGIFDEAALEFRKAVRRDPANIEAHFRLGQTLERQGDIDEALKWYEKTVGLQPAHVQAHLASATIYKDKGEMDRAIKNYESGIAAIPIELGKLFGNISLYTDMGFFAQVLKEYEDVQALERVRLEMFKELGLIYKSKGQVGRAMEIYEELQKVLTDDVGVLNELADIYEKVGLYKEAKDVYEKVSGLVFDEDGKLQKRILLLNRIAAHHAMAKIYEDQHMLEKAAAEYEKVLDFYQKDVFTLKQLAEVYRRLDKEEDAEVYYLKIIEIAPHDAEVRLALGDLYDKIDRLAEAETEYKRATEIAANDPRGFLALGRLYRRAGRLVEAEALYEKAAEFLPKNVQLYLALASLMEEMGETQKAVDAYRRALVADPKNREARIRLEAIADTPK